MATGRKIAGHSHRGSANGSTRGKERQKRRAEVRARDPRVQAAMAEVEAERKKLDDLIAQQEAAPAVGSVQGALYSAAKKEAEKAVLKAEKAAAKIEDEVTPKIVVEKADPGVHPIWGIPMEGEDNFRFASITAGLMLKAGYNIRWVSEYTGLGYDDLKHYAELDEDGYGVVEVKDE